MGFEELKQELIRQTDRKIASMRFDAKKELEKIREANKKEIADYRNNVQKTFDKEIKQFELREKASAQLEIKKLNQEIKMKLINEVFENLKSALDKLPKKDREKSIKTLLSKAEKEIKISTVYVNSKDTSTIRKYKVKKIDITGGLIAEDKNKNVKVDYSFESMLDILKSDSISEISLVLFK